LRLEALETRTLLSAVPLATGVAAVATPGDTVIPFHAQIGGTALESVLGIATKIDTLEQALDAYLNEIPGWHLTGGLETTPTYSGMVDGSLDIGTNGILKSAAVTLSGSADIGAAVEGYYGISVLHVGVGVAADMSANVNATASYSVDTNAWSFGGSASLDGYVKGYASAMAWPVKGEIYVRGDVNGGASISSSTGVASASMSLVGTVGADAQIKSLFGGWSTVASVSRNLGAWQGTASFNVGAWLKSEATNVAAVNRAAAVTAQPVAAVAQASLPTATVNTAAASQTTTVAAQPVAAVAQAATSALSAISGAAVANQSVTASAQPTALAASADGSALQPNGVTNPLTVGSRNA
jgi:hypothetical protein